MATKLLQPGAEAPNFTLYATPTEKLSLNQHRGKPTALAFYPDIWSPVAGDQIRLYNELLPELANMEQSCLRFLWTASGAIWAFADERKLRYPLLADHDPTGALAKAYGAYRDGGGVAGRGIFVVDTCGVIA